MSKSLKNLSDEIYLSHDDVFIDFSSAGLYLCGLQTTVATVACAASSVASCWLMPTGMVSAVRTLAITTLVGFLVMRKPLRVGRVRGVTTIFNALRPCVVLYVLVLTIEQLVHTCIATEHQPSGYTRRVVFHCSIACMAAAGLWRAAKPASETDAPFLGTAFCIVVIAMLPPPATPLSGPLCEAASLFGAGERLMRAFLFSALYVVHVYCSPPNRNTIHDLAVCVMRGAAAAVWVLGCHLFVVWVAIIQIIVALWARFGTDSSGSTTNYSSVDTHSDSGLSDAELGTMAELPRDQNGVLIAPYMRDPPGGPRYNGFLHTDGAMHEPSPVNISPPPPPTHMTHTFQTPSPSPSLNDGIPVDAHQLVSLVGQGGGATMTSARMAEIAASLR